MESTQAKDLGEVCPKRCRRSLGVRLAIYALVIVAVVGSAGAFAALHGNTQAKLMYYQFQVERMDVAERPTQRIMYRMSPAISMAADPRQFLSFSGQAAPVAHADAAMHSDAASSGDDDDCELLPPHVIPPGGAGDPPALDMFNQYAQSILGDDMQVLFVHQLAAANGARPIVVVEAGVEGGTTSTPEFEILLIEPASWSTLPRLTGRQRIPGFETGLVSGAATFYAGRLDAADAGAFHLVVEQGESGGRRILIQGKLAADGKSVLLARES